MRQLHKAKALMGLRCFGGLPQWRKDNGSFRAGKSNRTKPRRLRRKLLRQQLPGRDAGGSGGRPAHRPGRANGRDAPPAGGSRQLQPPRGRGRHAHVTRSRDFKETGLLLNSRWQTQTRLSGCARQGLAERSHRISRVTNDTLPHP